MVKRNPWDRFSVFVFYYWLKPIPSQRADNSTFTITGTTDEMEGTEVTLIIDGDTHIGTVENDGTGNREVNNPLEDGTYAIEAHITPLAGNSATAIGEWVMCTVSDFAPIEEVENQIVVVSIDRPYISYQLLVHCSASISYLNTSYVHWVTL